MAKFDPAWFQSSAWSGYYSPDWVQTVKAHLTPEGHQGHHYAKADYAIMLTRAIAVIERLARDLERANSAAKALEHQLERERVGGTELEDEVIDLRDKLDREVAAHRENCKLLYSVEMDRDNLNKRLLEMGAAFMELHDMAKQVVGPKPVAVKAATFGEMLKAAEAGEESWD